jgi:hypothetical protein
VVGGDEWVGRRCAAGVQRGGFEVAAQDGDCESVDDGGCEWVCKWDADDVDLDR